jgi:hypothetical protein
MLIKVEIISFAIDSSLNIPLVILKEYNGERTIPILIGSSEASAIAFKSLNINPTRPLTIDLANLIMTELGGTLKRVIIYDLIDQIFLARLQIIKENYTHLIDCRPSDAIALALRCESNIFVDEIVFEKNDRSNSFSKNKLKQNIANIDTLDFGRYYLD